MTIRDLISVVEPKEREKFSPLFEVVGQLRAKEIIQGQLLKDYSLLNGVTNLVEHKLGKIPNGWILIKKDANADIWQSEIDKSFLTLHCDANVTISLWVF